MRSASSMAFARLALPLLFASVAGCASDKDRVEKQISKLREEVLHLQSETDRMGERLDAMETRPASAPRQAEERSANNGTTVTRPKLKVVHVEPDGDGSASDVPMAEAAEPEADTGPRLLIQGEGKSIETRTMPASPVAAKTTKPESSYARKSESAKAAKPDAASK